MKERRRHQRVQVNIDNAKREIIQGATAVWPSQDQVDVFDMSYGGAAVGVPVNTTLATDEVHPVLFQLAGTGEYHVHSKIMWFSDKVVGLEFAHMTAEARMGFDRFLEDRLIGANLTPVAPKYFGPGVDYQYWYHGPKDTNVYLWTSPKQQQVQRAMVELDNQVVVFESGRFRIAPQPPGREIQEYSYAEADPVAAEETAPSQDFVRRVVSVLSQIPENQGPLRTLVEQMSQSGQ